MRLFLNDLRRESAFIKSKTLPAMKKVVEKCNFILGRELGEFEKKFLKYCGTKYAVGVANGTAALFLALKSLRIGAGDEVITADVSFTATIEAIIHAGSRPVLADVSHNNLLIDADLIEQKITAKTKAILPVHLYGYPADLSKIKKLCDKYNLFLINDCAQAHGSMFEGKPIATFGDVSCFSFMPAKNLGAYGDAGCIVTNNQRIAQKVRMLRDHGRKEKYRHVSVGYAERMDTLQAAVLNQKLSFLDAWNERRRAIARQYDFGFRGNSRIHIYQPLDNSTPAYHLYVIGIRNRDYLKMMLSKHNIDTGIHYPIPLHLQPAFKYLGYERGDFPIAELHSKKILSIPMHPFLRNSEVKKIITLINKYAG